MSFFDDDDRRRAAGRGRGGNPFGGNPFGGNPFGGNPFGFGGGPPGGGGGWPGWAGFIGAILGQKANKRAKRGDVRLGILALLAEKAMNGYQIMQEFEQRSQGAWRPSSGSVYPALSQLQ